MRIPTLILATLAAFPIQADDSAISMPSERSPIVGELDTRTSAIENHDAANRALLIELGPLTVKEKNAQIHRRTRKGRQIGVHRALPDRFTGDLVPHLDWAIDESGQHTAAITFSAQGAVSVRIAVQAELAAGGWIQIFDGDGQPRGSAFTPEDFNTSPVWLPSAEGETLTVQITIPSADALDDLSFTVTNVAHRFASLTPKAAIKILPSCSGHVDIACVTSQSRRKVADAVGRIGFEDMGGTFLCTGTLLAAGDTPGVFEPYFLTANHCVGTNAVAATVEALWFWQYTACADTQSLHPDFVYSFAGTNLLTTSPAQDSTLLEFKETLPGGLLYSGWSNRNVFKGSSVFSVHHPMGFAVQYSEGQVLRTTHANVDGNMVYDALETAWTLGLTESGSSGAGLFTSSGDYLVGVLSGGQTRCGTQGDVFGPFRDFFPHAQQWLEPSTYEPETFTHLLPAMPGADAGGIQGFVRIRNYSNSAGEVEIHAIDDTGRRSGPVTLELNAFQTRHFNSGDLEHGASSKGLHGAVGEGTGLWRLELETALNIRALGYIRTADGFVTSMHQLARTDQDNELKHYVPFFNPGSNTAIRSLLRVINPNTTSVTVTVEAWDDDGDKADESVRFSLVAGRAVQISAQELEAGDGAFTGRLGDGKGKWELVVTGTQPLQVMSLLLTASGHLTNLSQ